MALLQKTMSERPQFSEAICPISMTVMEDPVILAETGITYDRSAITAWFERGNRTCPCTGERVTSLQLIPNRALKSAIEKWKEDNAALPGSSPEEDRPSRPYPPLRSPSTVADSRPVSQTTKPSIFESCLAYFLPSSFRGVSEETVPSPQRISRKSTPRTIANQMTEAVRRQDEAGLYVFQRDGWSFDVLDDSGQGPLHVAANQDDPRLLNLLLGCGAQTEFRDKKGCTALHWASRWGHHVICKSLLHSGADINARSTAHTTPLHMAAYWGRLHVVEYLVQQGADLRALNDKRQRPIDAAQGSPQGAAQAVVLFLQRL